jgi:hypothetical protein
MLHAGLMHCVTPNLVRPANYPSKRGFGELAAWFRNSEGNLLGLGQSLR